MFIKQWATTVELPDKLCTIVKKTPATYTVSSDLLSIDRPDVQSVNNEDNVLFL